MNEQEIENLAIKLYDAYWSPQYISKPFWALWENQGLVVKEGFRAIAQFVLESQREITIPDHR